MGIEEQIQRTRQTLQAQRQVVARARQRTPQITQQVLRRGEGISSREKIREISKKRQLIEKVGKELKERERKFEKTSKELLEKIKILKSKKERILTSRVGVPSVKKEELRVSKADIKTGEEILLEAARKKGFISPGQEILISAAKEKGLLKGVGSRTTRRLDKEISTLQLKLMKKLEEVGAKSERFALPEEFTLEEARKVVRDPFSRVILETRAISGQKKFQLQTQPVPQVVEVGLLGQFALGGTPGTYLLKRPVITRLQDPRRVVIEARVKDKAIGGIGRIETVKSQLLSKLKLPKAAAKAEVPFGFAEEEIGRLGRITAQKGTVFLGKGRTISTETIAKELAKRGQVTTDISVSSVERLQAGKTISIKVGDETITSGVAIPKRGDLKIPFVAKTKELPSTTSFTGTETGTILKRTTPKIERIVKQVIEKAIKVKPVIAKPIVIPKTAPTPITSISDTKQVGVISGVRWKQDVPITTTGVTLGEVVSPKFQEKLGRISISRERIEEIQIPKTMQTQLIGEIARGREITTQITIPATITTPIDVPVTISATKSITKQRTKLIQKTPFVPPPKIPILPIPKLTRPTSTELTTKGKILVVGFDVYVKREGRWIKISRKALPKARALKLGAKITRGTLAASFKIIKSPQKIITQKKEFFQPSQQIFRSYKIVKGKKVPLTDMYIQRASKRLSTLGEVREIQKSKRRKSKGLKWL